MRAALLLLLTQAGLASIAWAQESDERMAKILNPDLDTTATMSGKSFYGGKDFSTKQAYSKPFYLTNFFSPKKYDTKSYSAGKYWTGEYYQGKNTAATAGKYQIPNSGKAAAVKELPVSDARESGKVKATNDYAGNRPYLVPGKSQKALNQQSDAQKPMTVDELRELLNKTR